MDKTVSYIVLFGLVLTLLSGAVSQESSSICSLMSLGGFPLAWTTSITLLGSGQVATYFHPTSFLIDLIAYSIAVALCYLLYLQMGDNKLDHWDVMLIIIVVLAVFFTINEPVFKGNILHDRPIFDSVFTFDDRASFTDTAGLLENAQPEKQKQIGLLGIIGNVCDWVMGIVIAGVMYILVNKADWKLLTKKN